MAKKRKKKPRSKNVRPPTFKGLNDIMEADQDRMARYFNAYIVIGLRKVPEKDQHKHQGNEEAPFWYFVGTPEIAGGLADWAATDIKLRQAQAEATQEPPPQVEKPAE